MKANLLLCCVFVLIVAIMTIVLAGRLSDEALAVVAGAVCGISASIPITIGLVIAASRANPVLRASREADEYERSMSARGTPVKVVGGYIGKDGRDD